MRFLSVFLIGMVMLSGSSVWETDLDAAKTKARQEHKYILLNFSGSDWCGPCIRMHKEIFGSEGFTTFASQNLVLVNADFPRLKKNQLPKEQQKKNDQLADKYNSQGSFPLTLLLDAEGKVIKSWEGYPDLTPEQFTGQLKAAMDAH